MDKNVKKKSKILTIWNNMIELIAVEEQLVQKLDNLEKSIQILSQRINRLEN